MVFTPPKESPEIITKRCVPCEPISVTRHHSHWLSHHVICVVCLIECGVWLWYIHCKCRHNNCFTGRLCGNPILWSVLLPSSQKRSHKWRQHSLTAGSWPQYLLHLMRFHNDKRNACNWWRHQVTNTCVELYITHVTVTAYYRASSGNIRPPSSEYLSWFVLWCMLTLWLQALNYRKFSSASDVWSFGMVVFEIWSLGRKPFDRVQTTKVFYRTKYWPTSYMVLSEQLWIGIRKV